MCAHAQLETQRIELEKKRLELEEQHLCAAFCSRAPHATLAADASTRPFDFVPACGCRTNLRWQRGVVTLAILGSQVERAWAREDSRFRVRHTLPVTILWALAVGGWVGPRPLSRNLTHACVTCAATATGMAQAG